LPQRNTDVRFSSINRHIRRVLKPYADYAKLYE
jgi:hypothetical protein